MNSYASITIGRNIGQQPMSLDIWDNFKRGLRNAIESRLQVSGWLFEGDGIGTWCNDREESHAVIVLFRHDERDISDLNRKLSLLARQYQQEAIGCAILPLISSHETLIYPAK